MTFVHLGRKYYQITLWATTMTARRKWLEVIRKQQEVMRERSLAFDTVSVSEGFFTGVNRVNCAAPFGSCLKALSCVVHSLIYENFREWDAHGVRNE